MTCCELLLKPDVHILDLLATADRDYFGQLAIMDARIECPPVGKIGISRIVGIHEDHILTWRDMNEFEEAFFALALPVHLTCNPKHLLLRGNDVHECMRQQPARRV